MTLMTALLLSIQYQTVVPVEAFGRGEPPYVIVVDRTPAAKGYERAAEELAALRAPAIVVDLTEKGLGTVFDELKKIENGPPKHVAFVVPPSRIEDNFVGRVFDFATKFDAEPDLDIAYGYITAATPDEAIELVRNTRRAEEDRAGKPRKFVAVGHTFREADLGMFALQQQAHMRRYGFECEAINPVDESKQWTAVKEQEMKKLDGASLVFFAGHGMGDWCCGIDADDYKGFTLDRAIVVNGACHSASMLLRHDIARETNGITSVMIPAERSICLRLIRAGAIAQFGSTASSSWMNVGFTIPEFFNNARSLGEALQTSLNAVIDREQIPVIRVLDFVEGEPSPQFLGPDQNPGHVQSISRVVLIGDPAYRPNPSKVAMLDAPVVPPRPHPMGDRAAAPSTVSPLRDKPIDDLVAALDRDIADGFVTLNEVINRGEPAVALLIKKLDTTEAWQIPKALGAIADKRAIDPLIRALERKPVSPFSDVVVEALEIITGEKAGTTAKSWRAVREKHKP